MFSNPLMSVYVVHGNGHRTLIGEMQEAAALAKAAFLTGKGHRVVCRDAQGTYEY